MLQQTRVDTVIPYYGRWLERFPDIETLAEAEEDEVLRVWQGLGYYSRARRLQEGARVVRETFGGVVPGNSEALRELPGVGESIPPEPWPPSPSARRFRRWTGT